MAAKAKGGRAAAATSHGFAPWVREEWQTAVLRVQGAVVAGRLWSWVLAADDRARLGGDLEAAYQRDGGAVGMWQRLRGVSYPQAVVAVGTALNLLDPATGQALLREFGEAPDNPTEAVEWAVRAGGLVLTEFPRQAWWRGESIPIDWATRDRYVPSPLRANPLMRHRRDVRPGCVLLTEHCSLT